MDWKGSPQFHPRRRNLFNETVGSRLCMNCDPKGGRDKSPHGCRELWALRTRESVLWALESLDKSFPVLDSSGSKLWQSLASTSKAILSHIPSTFSSGLLSTLLFFHFPQRNPVPPSYTHDYMWLRPPSSSSHLPCPGCHCPVDIPHRNTLSTRS